jgi:hypothetical protein
LTTAEWLSNLAKVFPILKLGSLTYKNMAALDGLPDKVWDIRMKQYGDSAAEQKVIDKRVENAHVVSSMLLRDITLR